MIYKATPKFSDGNDISYWPGARAGDFTLSCVLEAEIT